MGVCIFHGTMFLAWQCQVVCRVEKIKKCFTQILHGSFRFMIMETNFQTEMISVWKVSPNLRGKGNSEKKKKKLGSLREHRGGNDSLCYYNEIIAKSIWAIIKLATNWPYTLSLFCYDLLAKHFTVLPGHHNSFLFFHFHQAFQLAANVVDLVGCATIVHFCNFIHTL